MCAVGSLSLLALGEIALGVIMLVISAGGAVGVWAIAAQRRTVRRAVVTVIGLSTLVLGALAFREGFTGSALLSVVSGLVMLGELFNDDKGPTSDGVVLVLD